MSINQWRRRLNDNHQAAVIRWREFLEKGQRNRDARRLLGTERRDLLSTAEIDPRAKREVLEEVSLTEALSVLNPPSRTVLSLMEAGMLRHDAEEFINHVKSGQIDPDNPPPTTPSFTNKVLATLRGMKPNPQIEDEDGLQEDPVASARVSFCLEGLLRYTGLQAPLPANFSISRSETRTVSRYNNHSARITIENGAVSAGEVDAGVLRALAVSHEGSGELLFSLRDESRDPDEPEIFNFSIENAAAKLDGFDEIWPDDGPAADPNFWQPQNAPHEEMQERWAEFGALVNEVRKVVDPDWRQEPKDDEAAADLIEEPNNAIYLIFDLVYLAHRELFQRFLEGWVALLSAPWRHNLGSDAWQKMEKVMQIGLARKNGALAVLPYYPLRLAWHRATFAQIETWLAKAVHARQPLLFEPEVLSAQFAVQERPRLVHYDRQTYVESAEYPFFSLFLPEGEKRRARAPLGRARSKLDQFGRMWPFSLTRLHVAFQPGDAADDLYTMLSRQAEAQPDSAYLVRALVENATANTAFDHYLHTTGDQTTDLLTQEYQESMWPRLEYAKGPLDEEGESDGVSAHAALMVDAFRQEESGYKMQAGRLQPADWMKLMQMSQDLSEEGLRAWQNVSLAAAPYHSRQGADSRREVAYTPLSGDGPEYLRMLFDAVTYSVQKQTLETGAYYEVVRWDESAIRNLHYHADWVILFDRTLDKRFFEEKLAEAGVRLIDFYANLQGGYRLSVSSQRIETVKWQMLHVLRQFFTEQDFGLDLVASNILDSLSGFASGLLLKTLGGGSLAQEMLGLYATYLALRAKDLYRPGHDFLIPLDNYQRWFGRRTRRNRRADLLVVRAHPPSRLEMLAVESKWYKSSVHSSFVRDEFGPDGQLRATAQTLYSLFDPAQDRLDRDYWQRVLRDLLDAAPTTLHQILQQPVWELKVDGMVFVHQYTADHDLAAKTRELSAVAEEQIARPDEEDDSLAALKASDYFWRGPQLERLQLLNKPQLINLFGQEIN